VAEPVAPPADVAEAPAPTTHSARVSVKQYKAMKKVVRVKRKADGRTLDYREAKKEFGKKVSWRRQFAAGWKLGGGELTHVSKAETKAISKTRKRYQPPAPPLDARLLQAAPNCRGRTGHELHPGTDYYHWDYFNSCQTNKIIRNLTWCLGGAGFVGTVAGNPGVGAIMALFMFMCGGAVAWIAAPQADSDLNAIIVKNGDIVKVEPKNPTPQNPVRYQVPVRISPQ